MRVKQYECGRMKSLFKVKKLENIKKRERNGVSKEYFILSVGRFVAKI